MKNYIIIIQTLFLIFFFSNCKYKEKEQSVLKEDLISENTKGIVDYLRDLSLTSSFNFQDLIKDKIQLYIEEDCDCNDFSYPFKIVYESDELESGNFTIATMHYNPVKKELYDISNNLSTPKRLTYDKSVENNLISKINETCGPIPINKKLEKTSLPFSVKEWQNWYDKQQYNDLEESDVYKYYKIKEDYILLSIILNKDIHYGLVPYLYFLIDENDSYKTVLLFSRMYDSNYPAYGVRDKFYDIITIKNDSIISTVNVGYLPDINETGKSYYIHDELTFTVYDESMVFDSAGPIPKDTFNITNHKISKDGQIIALNNNI